MMTKARFLIPQMTLDRDGIAQRGLLVRHLVLPQDLAGSADSLSFLAALSRDMSVSLMAQYSPQHRAAAHPPLERTVTTDAYQAVVDAAWSLGLTNCYVQEMESSQRLVPGFQAERPFR